MMTFTRAACVSVLAAVCLAWSIQLAAAVDPRVLPDTVTIFVEDGKGSAPFVVVGGPAGTPEPRVLDATGAPLAVSAADIQVSFDASTSPGLLTGRVSLATKTVLDSSVTYTSRLLLRWKNGTTKDVALTIKSAAVAFQLSPDHFDAVLGGLEPQTKRLFVQNTGKAVLQTVTVTSDTLKSADGRHQVEFATTSDAPTRIPPGQEASIDVKLPLPMFAGTYTGSLRVTAPDGTRQLIPVSLKTRGPQVFAGSPLVLFFITVGVGAWLSSKLEAWFAGGGLRRAEAIRSLRLSESEITRLSSELQKLVTADPNTAAPKSVLALAIAQAQATLALQQVDAHTIDQIVADADRAAGAAAGGDQLLEAVHIAVKQFPAPGNLKTVIGELDKVSFPMKAADAQKYADGLTKALREARTTAGGRGAGDAATMLTVESDSVQDVDRQISRMAWLHRGVVAVVVVAGAYIALYATNLTFGTASDYIGAFFWSLGLTQTGSQVLTRIHK